MRKASLRILEDPAVGRPWVSKLRLLTPPRSRRDGGFVTWIRAGSVQGSRQIRDPGPPCTSRKPPPSADVFLYGSWRQTGMTAPLRPVASTPSGQAPGLAAARRAKDAQSEFAHPRRSRCRLTGRSRCRLTVGEQTPFAHAAQVTISGRRRLGPGRRRRRSGAVRGSG